MSARSRLFAGAGLAALIILGSAVPASAHAILLRSDPAPQTTVARTPDAVRLYFSESLEVALSSVQISDVNGRRVDTDPIRYADGNRQIILGSRLKDGTHTVTWRVTSGDGHTVHGDFIFYVGAPSSKPAIAVTADRGPSVGATWGAGVIRFAWFGALCVLVGLVVIRRWVWTPSLRATGLATGPGPASVFKRCFGPGMVGAWVVLAIAGGLSLVFQTALVSARSLSEAARPSILAQTLDTTFGRVWEARMALVALGALPVVALVRRRPTLGVSRPTWITMGGVVAGGLCLASALDGHARTLGRTAVAVPSLALHVGAVTVWVGGLAVFMVVGGAAWRTSPPESRARLARELVIRFGRLAVAAVVVLVVTGVVNAYGNFDAFTDLWDVAYGRVVTAKIVLLALALALAARHRWVSTRRLAVEPGGASTAAVRGLRRDGLVEMVAVVGAVALAASLVAMVPGRSLAKSAGAKVSQEHRAGSYTVRLVIDPIRVGANEVHVSFVNRKGLEAAEVSATQVSVGPAKGGESPVSMRPISPGRFVGDTTLGAPGAYSLSVTAVANSPDSATFTFNVRDSGQN